MARMAWVDNEAITHTKLNQGLEEIYARQSHTNYGNFDITNVNNLYARKLWVEFLEGEVNVTFPSIWNQHIDAAGYNLSNVGALTTSSLAVSGVPITMNGVPQTPWAQDINAAFRTLYNVQGIVCNTLTVGGQPVAPGAAVSSVFGRAGAVTKQLGDYSAADVTNAVSTATPYSNPDWIASLAYSKLTGAPAAGVSSVFGRAGAVVAATAPPWDYTAEQVLNAVSTAASYTDPPWIASLAWGKIVGVPSVGAFQSPWVQNINGAGFSLTDANGIACASLTVNGVPITMNGVPQSPWLGGIDGSGNDLVNVDAIACSSLTIGGVPVVISPGGTFGAVDSVFGRTGHVAAVSGDYSWNDIAGKPVAFTPDAHFHATTDITSGLMATARLGSGSATGNTFLRGDNTWAIPIAPELTAAELQSPWVVNIEGAGFNLSNAGKVSIAQATAPAELTAVSGNVGVVVRATNTLTGSIGTTTATALQFVTGDISRMAITAAGDVGIPTPNASYKLDVQGDVNISGAFRVNGVALVTGAQAQTPWTQNIDAANFTLDHLGRMWFANYDVPSNRIRLGAAAGSGNEFMIAGETEAVRTWLTGSLHAQQTIVADALIESTSGGFKFPDGTTQLTASIGAAPQTPWTSDINAAHFSLNNVGADITHTAESEWHFWCGSGQPIVFYTAGAERARISAAGNFGIGSVNPSRKLDVDGGAISVTYASPDPLWAYAGLLVQGSGAYNPRIAFHYAGVGIAPQIGVDSTGAVRTYDTGGTVYCNFKAADVAGATFNGLAIAPDATWPAANQIPRISSNSYLYTLNITANGSITSNARITTSEYVHAAFFNQSSPVENPAIANIFADNGDGYHRKASLAHLNNSISPHWANIQSKPTYASAHDQAVGLATTLIWKNYGQNHVIFDAGQGTAPNGAGVNNTNPANYWAASYPTLMGWNGSSTYGVRVDYCRYADSAGSAPAAAPEAWQTVAYRAGWTHYGIPVQYRKVNGMVQFKGVAFASGNWAAGSYIFDLPAGYRPVGGYVYLLVYHNNSASNFALMVEIQTGGAVRTNVSTGLATNPTINFDGLSFAL